MTPLVWSHILEKTAVAHHTSSSHSRNAQQVFLHRSKRELGVTKQFLIRETGVSLGEFRGGKKSTFVSTKSSVYVFKFSTAFLFVSRTCALMRHHARWRASREALGRAAASTPRMLTKIGRTCTNYLVLDEIAYLSRVGGVDYHTVKYWKMKFENPLFRSDPWGGAGRQGYSPADFNQIRRIIGVLLLENQQPNLLEISTELRRRGFPYSRSSISRLLKKWRWSFKIPTVFQRMKYTEDNILYYNEFLEWFVRTDPIRIKFVDEVHFDKRGKYPFWCKTEIN